MLLGRLGLGHRARGRRPRRRRHRGRLRGAEHRPRLPQRRLHPRREPVRARATSCGSPGVAGSVEDFTPPADDAARPGRRRPHRAQRRDQGGVEPDPRLVPDQPGRARSPTAPTSTRRSAVVDDVGREMAARAGVEAPDPRGAARRAGRGARRVRGHAQDPRDGPGARPMGRGRRAAQAPARRVRRQRHRDPPAAARGHLPATTTDPVAPGQPGAGPSDEELGRPTSDRRAPGCAASTRRLARMTGQPIEAGGIRDRRAVPRLARDREPPRRDADVPARSRPSSHRPTRPPALYAEAEADFEAFWARLARERIDWFTPFDDDARVGPAVREVVHRRQAEHQLQLPRPSRRERASATRSPTTGSASPATRGR